MINNLFVEFLSTCKRHSAHLITSVNYGLLQGSVLGPLLYFIYINDLRYAIIASCPLHVTDDACLLSIHLQNKYSKHDFMKLAPKALKNLLTQKLISLPSLVFLSYFLFDFCFFDLI